MTIYNVYEYQDEIYNGTKFELEADNLDDAVKQYLDRYGEDGKRHFEVYESDGDQSVLIWRGSTFYNNDTGEKADQDLDYMNDGNHYEVTDFTTIELNEDDQQ